jgi:hypothetical protein
MLVTDMFLNTVSKQFIMSVPVVLYHSPERSNPENMRDTFTTRFSVFEMWFVGFDTCPLSETKK